MCKEKLQKEIDSLKEEMKRASEHADLARIKIERLEEELKELDKKPMMRLTDDAPDWLLDMSRYGRKEITHYRKYSDTFIEFEVFEFRYRYIESITSNYIKYPLERGVAHYCSYPKDIFQIYDYSCKDWKDVDYIKYIELIPGVDEYDK